MKDKLDVDLEKLRLPREQWRTIAELVNWVRNNERERIIGLLTVTPDGAKAMFDSYEFVRDDLLVALIKGEQA